MRLLRHLYVQVLIGIILGGVVGYVWPDFGAQLKPLGDAFVNLIKMLIGPIIFTTVVVGSPRWRWSSDSSSRMSSPRARASMRIRRL